MYDIWTGNATAITVCPGQLLQVIHKRLFLHSLVVLTMQ